MARGIKTPVWVKLVAVLAVAAVAAGGGIYLGSRLFASESREAQVVKAVVKEEKVVLLTAAITGVKEKRADTKFLGLFELAGTERAMFVKYEFNAQLGIDGSEVKIEPTGEDHYRIVIPSFISLGFDAPRFSTAIESNGFLSWSTPEIDKLKVAEETLGSDTVKDYLATYRPALEAQAKTFYSGIILSINPEAKLEFVFSN